MDASQSPGAAVEAEFVGCVLQHAVCEPDLGALLESLLEAPPCMVVGSVNRQTSSEKTEFVAHEETPGTITYGQGWQSEWRLELRYIDRTKRVVFLHVVREWGVFARQTSAAQAYCPPSSMASQSDAN